MGVNFAADVAQNEAAAAEAVVVLEDPRVVEMEVDPRFVKATLADEEVRSLRLNDQLLGPPRIAGVRDRLTIDSEAEPE